METGDYDKLKRWLTNLEEVAEEYSGRTLDNIIDNIKARISAYEKRV